MAISGQQLDSIISIPNPNWDLREAWDAEVENFVAKIPSMNNNQLQQFIINALETLSISENSADELANRGKFWKLLGVFTGSNNKLRDISANNLRECQRATLKIIDKLAENQLLLAESIKICMDGIIYLKVANIRIKQFIEEIYTAVNERLVRIEEELLFQRYRIKSLEIGEKLRIWSDHLRGDSFRHKDDLLLKLFEFLEIYKNKVAEVFQQYDNPNAANLFAWPESVFQLLKPSLESLGYCEYHGRTGRIDVKITIKELAESIYEEAEYIDEKYINMFRLYLPLKQFDSVMWSTIILWESYHSGKRKIPKENLMNRLKNVYNIDIDSVIDYSIIARDLLCQLKLFEDNEYIKFNMVSVFGQIIYKIQNAVNDNPEKVTVNVGDWTYVVVGIKYLFYKCDQKMISLYYQYIEESADKYSRLVYVFEKFDHSKGRIVYYLLNRDQGLFPNFEIPNNFELCKVDHLDWYNFEEAENIIRNYFISAKAHVEEILQTCGASQE